jgi:hypothetical protein
MAGFRSASVVAGRETPGLAGCQPGRAAILDNVGGGGDIARMDSSADLSDRVDRLEARFEVRMDRFEARLDRFEARMDGMDARLQAVEVKLGEMSGKLDMLTSQMTMVTGQMTMLASQMTMMSGQMIARLPTWWQMPAIVGAILAMLGAFYAIAKRLGLG